MRIRAAREMKRKWVELFRETQQTKQRSSFSLVSSSFLLRAVTTLLLQLLPAEFRGKLEARK